MSKLKRERYSNYKKIKVLSIVDHKKKKVKKAEWIKEFEEGPQPIPTCTCGQHTDPNQFLTEKQVTKHYLKDRRRYVKGLKGDDPLECYMETFKILMSDAPLVKLNMETDLASLKYISNHLSQGMMFYEQYIENDQNLTYKSEIWAKKLRKGYEDYKVHIVKSLINLYIINKRWFISENSVYPWRENELLTKEDSLDTTINETEGYIKFMEEHFYEKDKQIETYILFTAAQNLDRKIKEKLNCTYLSRMEIYTLGNQMKKAIEETNQRMSQNRIRDLNIIQEEYNKVKDDCSLEYKAKTLIDIELRKREIDGRSYTEKSEFTASNNAKKLTKTIGMESIIWKFSTKELQILFDQFKALEE